MTVQADDDDDGDDAEEEEDDVIMGVWIMIWPRMRYMPKDEKSLSTGMGSIPSSFRTR